MLKRLKLMRKQGSHGIPVFCFKVTQTLVDGRSKRLVVGVKDGLQALLLDEFPDSFDQVQVGGVRRQLHQVDAQLFGQTPHQIALLVASVVQHQGDRLTPHDTDTAFSKAHTDSALM
jgi:hypothetical protein